MREISLIKLGKKLNIDVSKVHFTIDNDNIGHAIGEIDIWEDVVRLGQKLIKKFRLKNLVNDIHLPGQNINIREDAKIIEAAKALGDFDTVDICIIGAGVIGNSIARELAKYDLKICVVEKEHDVADGATKANNGMIHPGNAVIPGTLKAKMNLRGNYLYDKFSKELGFKFNRSGSLIYYTEGCSKKLFFLAWLGAILNRVPDSRLLSGKKVKELEPSITDDVKLGLWTGTTGFVDGFEVAIAAAENACDNGVKYYLATKVLDIKNEGNKVSKVITSKGIIKTKIIINCAGIYADYIAEWAGDRFYTIHPRKGVILILDKNTKGSNRSLSAIGKASNLLSHTKGGGGERTVAGNPLFGPSAKEVQDREDLSVSQSEFEYAYNVGSQVYKDGTRDKVITYFAGLRAADYKEDFIIEESKKIDGFIHCSAIQSPGLASAPAIAEYVEEIVKNIYKRRDITLSMNLKYNPIREAKIPFNDLSIDEKVEMIKKDSRYGNVICRCENITEGEIVEALHRPLPCLTIDGIKRRVRASAGRCQGGFCGPRLVEIIARELNISPLDVSQKGHDKILVDRTRED